MKSLHAEGQQSQIHKAVSLICPCQFCSECLVETCVSTNFASCFLLLLRFDRGDRVFGERLIVCSWLIVNFLLEGSSGGASGHRVCFDGTVISNGGSIIHL